MADVLLNLEPQGRFHSVDRLSTEISATAGAAAAAAATTAVAHHHTHGAPAASIESSNNQSGLPGAIPEKNYQQTKQIDQPACFVLVIAWSNSNSQFQTQLHNYLA
jgi:hypothetical protein